MGTNRYVALLRGINAAAATLLRWPTSERRSRPTGTRRSRTYIQSGNVLFESDASRDALEDDLEAMLERRIGVPLVVVLRSRLQLRNVIDRAPKGFGQEPGTTYHSDVVFLKASLSSQQAMRVVELRQGVDQATRRWRALLLPLERAPDTEPDEPHRRHPGVSADDSPKLGHDDEAARLGR